MHKSRQADLVPAAPQMIAWRRCVSGSDSRTTHPDSTPTFPYRLPLSGALYASVNKDAVTPYDSHTWVV